MQSGLIVIAGPTASGKSELAVQLARELDCAIVNGDSRQLYKEMRIGTAMPMEEEFAQAKHLLFASHSIHEPLTAGDFARLARHVIQKELSQSKYCILVGGSGLYIKGLLEGFSAVPEIPESFRNCLNTEFEQAGLPPLQAELQISDPEYFQEVDIQNPHRVIRALEVIRHTGKKFSELRNLKSEGLSAPWKAYFLNPDREELYNRINTRVLKMVSAGLEAEVTRLMPHKDLQALQTVGYSEWWPYFEGNRSKEEVIKLIQQYSRNYAKRQLTWFKKQDQFEAIDPDSAFLTVYSDLLK